MERVGEHPVPAGPLAVRWLGYALPVLRAGAPATVRLRLRNSGTARWRRRVLVSCHWLDDLGNAIIWDGPRTSLPHDVGAGEEVEVAARVRAPQPPGSYQLAFDLLEEFRFWFAEVGSHVLEVKVPVLPRIEERRLTVVVHGPTPAATDAALRAQEEPLVGDGAVATAHLVPGAQPATDWSRRILDAHAEGFAAVGGSIDGGGRELAPWRSDGGRNPGFAHPLLLPSLLTGIAVAEHEGLPAYFPERFQNGEPWLFDGRIRLRLQRDRPRA
jgi:Ig-like domain from next to BRCA1 gene